MLKRVNDSILAFMKKYIAQIMGIVGVIAIFGAIMSMKSNFKPHTAAEFASTTVMILNDSQTSGGSGVILKSSLSKTYILTNKHICRIIEKGGTVVYKGRTYSIDSYKKYPIHDLCMITVMYSFNITTQIAHKRPDYFSSASISGHPGLMPPVLTKGYFSGRERIFLVVGYRKCTKKDDFILCLFNNGYVPVLEDFDAQLVTATILPGSSGSGVWNEDGELSGLVFAGRGGGLMYAYIVPYEYLVDFLETEKNIPWQKAGDGVNYRKLFDRIFDFEKFCKIFNELDICKKIKSRSIWSK